MQSTWSPEKISQAQHDDPVISIVLQTRLNTTKREEPPSDWTGNHELRRYRQVWKQLEVVHGVLHRRVAASSRKDGLVLVAPRQMRADLLIGCLTTTLAPVTWVSIVALRDCTRGITGQGWQAKFICGWLSVQYATNTDLHQRPLMHPWIVSQFCNPWKCGQWTSWAPSQ